MEEPTFINNEQVKMDIEPDPISKSTEIVNTDNESTQVTNNGQTEDLVQKEKVISVLKLITQFCSCNSKSPLYK